MELRVMTTLGRKKIPDSKGAQMVHSKPALSKELTVTKGKISALYQSPLLKQNLLDIFPSRFVHRSQYQL